jgi:hypothetical protein
MAMGFLIAHIQVRHSSCKAFLHRLLTSVEPNFCRPRFTLDTFNEHGWLCSVQQRRT